MQVEFVPLLKVQRDLYRMPRSMERFRTYLQTMMGAKTDDLELPPLVAMNPMGKDHLPALLDALIELDADGVAARAVAAAAERDADVPGRFKLSLVLADDAMGGWTNRYDTELSHRFENAAILKRGWLSGLLWTSETPSARTAEEEALKAVYRAAHIHYHGQAHTLRDMMAQEGFASAMAGCREPSLDTEVLAYTREVIAPHLDKSDRPTVMACLFGDEAARALGYAPQGLSRRAGFALALHDERQSTTVSFGSLPR